jgi:hypothetical protein
MHVARQVGPPEHTSSGICAGGQVGNPSATIRPMETRRNARLMKEKVTST